MTAHYIFQQWLIELPSIIICIGSIFAALLLWKRAPSASLYVVLALGLTLLLLIGAPVVRQGVHLVLHGDPETHAKVDRAFALFSSVIRAISTGLLVIAVYAGRKSGRARQLSDASEVVRNLLGEGSGGSGTIVPKGPEGLPASESVARPLARLEPEKQRKVWKQAVKEAPGGKVTAKQVEELVKKEQGEVAPPDHFEDVVLGHRDKQRAVHKAVEKDRKWPKPNAWGL